MITPTLVVRAATSSIPSPSASASCITVQPLKNGYVPEWACNAVYNYSPSLASAIVFAILFGLVFTAHAIQSTVYKKWRVGWVIGMGASWEFLSACLLAAGSQNQQAAGLAGGSLIFALLAPLWINAGVYMIMARMIYFYLPNQKVWGVPATRLSYIFVASDIFSFIVQACGGIMTTPGHSASTVEAGLHVYMGGIGLQQASIVIFIAYSIRFCILKLQDDPEGMRKWKGLVGAVFFSLAMITMRIIYRLIEFSKGLDPAKNPLPFHQVYSSCLDSLPMFLALTSLAIFHTGRYLHGENSELPKGSRWLCCLCKRKEKRQESLPTPTPTPSHILTQRREFSSTPSSEDKIDLEKA